MTDPAAEWVPIDSLHPWDRNPRKNDEAAKALAEWLRAKSDELGVEPEDLWTSAMCAQLSSRRIVAGHTRFKMAHILGLPRVPVRFLDVDDRTAAQLALADNRHGERAGWDVPELASLLTEVADLPTAELMGWDSEALAKLADEVPDFGPLEEPEEKVAKTCPHCGGEL